MIFPAAAGGASGGRSPYGQSRWMRWGLLRRAGGGDLIVMTGADSSAAPAAQPGRRWDVALSFAGAQRDYVEQVAGARSVRCFYDADEQVRPSPVSTSCANATKPKPRSTGQLMVFLGVST